jgi:cyclophilin family peptidyl-prolyl cis-trans isomerase
MNMKQIGILIGVPVLVIVLIVFASDRSFGLYPVNGGEKATDISNKSRMQAPISKIDITKDYKVVLHTTYGDITIKVNALDTPIAATNFVYLARSGYYNNTVFHRVVNGFMIQGGDPTGTGSGGPGYSFDDEAFEGNYTRGTVAMANSGPNTNGSQFFIMVQDRNDIPRNYVIFGYVTNGIETVDKIATAPAEDNGRGEVSKPVTPVNITSVDIIEE